MKFGHDCFDAAIIGGSLAGSVSAYLLGLAGLQVAILDPQIFPRRKCCGEGLSTAGQEYLEQLGLWTVDLAQEAIPFSTYRLHFDESRTVELKSRKLSAAPLGYGISRTLLDTSVNARASALPNVTRIDERVDHVQQLAQNHFELTTESGLALRASNVVYSCSSGISKLFPEATYTRSTDQRFGMTVWCEVNRCSFSEPAVEIFHHAEGQYIVTPLADDQINISVLLSKTGACGLSKAILFERALSCARLAGYEIKDTTETRGASAIHSSRLLNSDFGAYPIGDAVERLDPISGLGMTHAIFSAALAAACISDPGLDATAALKRYHRVRNNAMVGPRLFTQMSARLARPDAVFLRGITIASPTLASFAMSLVRALYPRLPEQPERVQSKFEVQSVVPPRETLMEQSL